MTQYTAETHQERFTEITGQLRDALSKSGFEYLIPQLDEIRDRNAHDDFDEFLETMGYDAANWAEAVTTGALSDEESYNPLEALRKIREARTIRDNLKSEAYKWTHAKMLLRIAEHGD